MWVQSNSKTINSVFELRKKVFYEEEISEYIKAHTVVSEEELKYA